MDKFIPIMVILIAVIPWALEGILVAAPTTPDGAGLYQVSVDLPGPPSHIKGIQTYISDVGAGAGSLLEPQLITLHLQDGVQLRIRVRSSSVIITQGAVLGVILSPLVNPVSYAELRKQVVKTLADIGADYHDIELQMDRWGQDIPPPLEGGITIPMRASLATAFHGLGVGIEVNGNPHGWFYQLEFTVIKPRLLRAISPSSQPTALDGGTAGTVSLGIPQRAADVKGFQMHVLDRGMSEVDLLDPDNVTLTLGDGQQVSVLARSLNIMSFDGVIRGVYVRRPMRPVRFKEAEADAMHLLDTLGIMPDEGMKRMMSSWPADVAGVGETKDYPLTYQTGLRHYVHKLDLTLRFCPDPAVGWYYLLLLRDPYDKAVPSTQPSAPTAASGN